MNGEAPLKKAKKKKLGKVGSISKHTIIITGEKDEELTNNDAMQEESKMYNK